VQRVEHGEVAFAGTPKACVAPCASRLATTSSPPVRAVNDHPPWEAVDLRDAARRTCRAAGQGQARRRGHPYNRRRPRAHVRRPHPARREHLRGTALVLTLIGFAFGSMRRRGLLPMLLVVMVGLLILVGREQALLWFDIPAARSSCASSGSRSSRWA
jgi:hypothetical protein